MAFSLWQRVCWSHPQQAFRFLQSANCVRCLAGVAAPDVGSEIVQERAQILNGKQGSAQWLQELQPEVQSVRQMLKRSPRLSVILVGDRPDSHLYVKRKAEICQKVGIEVVTHRMQASIGQQELEDKVRQTCREEGNDAVLIQLPLPRHLDEESVTNALDPWKDVDGVHPLNMGQAALGCMHLLKLNHIEVENKTAVVVGDSNYVGIPLSVLLRNENAAIVSVCHGISYKELFEDPEHVQKQRAEAETCNPAIPGPIDKWSIESMNKHDAQCPIERNVHLPSITRTADILIVAVGWPKLVKQEWVKPGAVVIDVGINVIPNKKENSKAHIAGDVDFEAVCQIASAISPVPGGVGPMTIAGVVHNTIQAANYRIHHCGS